MICFYRLAADRATPPPPLAAVRRVISRFLRGTKTGLRPFDTCESCGKCACLGRQAEGLLQARAPIRPMSRSCRSASTRRSRRCSPMRLKPPLCDGDALPIGAPSVIIILTIRPLRRGPASGGGKPNEDFSDIVRRSRLLGRVGRSRLRGRWGRAAREDERAPVRRHLQRGGR